MNKVENKMSNERLCMNCNIPMKKTYVKYKRIKFEARECSKCKEKIFTEDLTMKAISKLESSKLQREYVKKPIKIGHSWGITFPKEISDTLNLENPKIELKIHPNLEKRKIEINLK